MLQLLSSPVRFFDNRQARPPNWALALAAPSVCAGLQGAAALMFSAKIRPLMVDILPEHVSRSGLPPRLLIASVTALGYPMFLGMLILAMLALNVMVRRPGSPARLAEFTALGFYTQVPTGLMMIAVAWLWQPDSTSFSTPTSTTDLMLSMSTYRDALLSEPLPSTGRLLSLYSLVWLAAVLASALKVVARLSTGATALAALTLLTICAGGPLVGMLLEIVL